MAAAIALAAIFTLFTATAEMGARYRVAVIFGSHSSGIDRAAFGRFQEILKDFEASHRVRLNYRVAYWGREGEFSLCFELSEIAPGAQAKFIAALRSLKEKPVNGWTDVEENNGCRTHGPVRHWSSRPD